MQKFFVYGIALAATLGALDGAYTLRVKGSTVSETLQVQAEGDWAGIDNTAGLSIEQGQHLFWKAADSLFHFRSGENTPLSLRSDGKVGINTDSLPGNHSLYVKGSMIMEEGFVKLSQNWPDYVFAPNYALMPLAEVGNYIEDHGRLPGMPSAAQVAEEGVAVGETQRLLTEKVEELTLYLLEISSQLQSVTDRNEALNSEVETLRNEIATLRGEK